MSQTVRARGLAEVARVGLPARLGLHPQGAFPRRRDDPPDRGKVVNRLRQVTSAIKQDGANQVSIITSTAERQAAVEFAKAAAMRPHIVGEALAADRATIPRSPRRCSRSSRRSAARGRRGNCARPQGHRHARAASCPERIERVTVRTTPGAHRMADHPTVRLVLGSAETAIRTA